MLIIICWTFLVSAIFQMFLCLCECQRMISGDVYKHFSPPTTSVQTGHASKGGVVSISCAIVTNVSGHFRKAVSSLFYNEGFKHFFVTSC